MKIKEIWNESLNAIESLVTKHVFDTWFRPITPLHYEHGTVTITVPNKFFGERLRENYYQLIHDQLSKQIPDQSLKILFVEKEVPLAPVDRSAGASQDLELDKKERRRSGRTLNLISKYTFGTFVVGGSNQFAHAASRRVAERPGEVYNPLFIYGGVGLGKTHLLHAIGNHISDHYPDKKIFYISSEQFTNEVINSIRYDRMIDFRNRYRTVDVLLIDDIQFIAGKERTQEEFFHTFNTLYETNKQIVISSDRSTKEMLEMEERLRSRFEMGLIADIQPPDVETRTAIIKRKSELEGIHLDDEVALFIASHIKTNIRELEGSLTRLGAFSSLTGEPITIELAKRVLGDILDEKQRVITVDEIQKVVADRFRIKIPELKAKKRTKTLVYPRQVAMYLCRELTEMSFPEIGKHFGGKDHSTVIHAFRHIQNAIASDTQTKELVSELIKKIKMK
jgi:chromosomal replication initiator protein